MKKFISLLLAMSLALSLAACSSAATGTADSASNNASSASASSAQTETQAETQTTSADMSQTANADGGAVAVSNIVAEDGTVLVEREITAPALTFANADAQKAVEADLAKLYADFDGWTQEIADFARDYIADYANYAEASVSTQEEYEFNPYYGILRISAERVDDTVISLVIDYEGYSGGAHGWDNRFTRNYDAVTGEQITFDKLGKNFRTKAEELVLAQADSIVADSSDFIFFEDYAQELPYVVADGTEKRNAVTEKVYGSDAILEDDDDATLDPMFYFSDEGIVFIAGQYIMKPYVSGIIEFPIPYADFGDSLNSTYVK